MTTHPRPSIQAGGGPGNTVPEHSRRGGSQLPSLTTAADLQLQFDAVIWRMRRSAAEGSGTTTQLVATLLHCALALERLGATSGEWPTDSDARVALAGDQAEQAHQGGTGDSSDQHGLDRFVLDVADGGIGR